MMYGLLLYFLFGWFVIKFEKPIHFAGGYAGFVTVMSVVSGQSFLETLLGAFILFGFTAFVFMIVDRYGDQVFAPLAVLAIGGMILVGLSYYG